MLKVFFCLRDSRWMRFYHFGTLDRMLSVLFLGSATPRATLKQDATWLFREIWRANNYLRLDIFL